MVQRTADGLMGYEFSSSCTVCGDAFLPGLPWCLETAVSVWTRGQALPLIQLDSAVVMGPVLSQVTKVVPGNLDM